MNSLTSSGKEAPSLDPFVSMRVGHLLLDVRHRRMHCLNDVAQQLHDEGVPFTSNDLAGQDLQTLAGQPVRAADLPVVIAWQQGRPAEATFILRQGGKVDRYLFWSAAPVRDSHGQVTAILASVSTSPPGFDWQALAGLAHDLRTPLQNFTYLLAALKESRLSGAQKLQFLETARSAAERAMQIARDLLLWCRGPTQSGRGIEFGWFPIGPFLHALVQEQMAAAQRKGLTLMARVTPALGWDVCADRVRLGRLLSNLLTNAVRYTNTGRVALTANWRDEHAGRTLVLGVVDTGTGIAPEERESIFQPFEQGRAGKESDSGGSGVGLAVVDRLVKELGLELEVYSEHGHGSAFHLLLPPHVLRPEKST